jgi:WD40 repeat protein
VGVSFNGGSNVIYLVTTGDQSNFQVWEAITGVRLKNVSIANKNMGPIVAAKMRSDGKTVIAGLRSGPIISVDLLTGTSRSLANVRGLTALDINISNSLLAVGNSDGGVCVFSMPGAIDKECTPLLTYRGHSGPITDVVFDDNTSVLSGSTDKLVYRWSAVTGKELQCCEGHDSAITCIVALGGYAAMSGSDIGEGQVKLWHMDLGAEIRTTPSEPAGVSAIAAHSGQALLYVATKQSAVNVWNLRNMTRCVTWPMKLMSPIKALWVDDANRWLLVGTAVGLIYVLSVETLLSKVGNPIIQKLSTGSLLTSMEVLSGVQREFLRLNTEANSGTNI